MIGNRNIFLTLFTLFIVVCWTSCAKEKTSTVAPSNLLSKLLFVHAATDVAKVDFYLDTYKQNSSPVIYSRTLGYFGARGGEQSFVIRIPNTNLPLISDKIALDNRANYTMVFTGLSSSTAYPLGVLFIPDSAQALPSIGKAKLRFVNASPNGQLFDIYANNTLAFASSPYLQVTDYLELPAGTWNFKINLTKTPAMTSDSTVADVERVVLQDGRLYTLFTRGIPGRIDSAALNAFVIGGANITP
jgi:hypothetical protein